MRKMYILTLRLFETLVVCHICKSTIVEFEWKLSFFPLSPPWGARAAWWEWVRALASQQCGPGSNPGVDALRGSKFVVGSLPCSERFFIGYSDFPLSPQEPTLQSIFQFDLEWRTRLNEFIRTRWCFVGKQITIYNRFGPSSTFLKRLWCLQTRIIHYHWPAIFCLRLHVLFPCRCCWQQGHQWMMGHQLDSRWDAAIFWPNKQIHC